MEVETHALEPMPLALANMPAGYIPLEVASSEGGLPSQFVSWIVRAVERGIKAAKHSDFNLVYATNNNLFNLTVSYILARRLSLPCVAVVHHLRWVAYYETMDIQDSEKLNSSEFLQSLLRGGLSIREAFPRIFGAYAETKLLQKFDGFTTVSRTIGRQVARLVPRGRVYVSGNGFSIGSQPLENCMRDQAALFVGRLDEGKGLLDLLTAWQKVLTICPQAKLNIVGEGVLKQQIFQLADRRGIAKSVRFHGFLGDEEVARLRSRSRLFVSLSNTEGFGISIAEALASGLPVVAWDLPPLHEVFAECPSIHLSPIGHLDDAAKGVARILQLSDERWGELSDDSTRYARRFSWLEAAQKELQALQSVKEAFRSSR
jgi:glycosyltransferase involved in cell wall biosynthesis